MKNTITKNQFIDSLNKAIPGTFSLEGAEAIFEYLTAIEKDTGREFELDPIGVRCSFTEYASREAALEDYSAEELENPMHVIELPDGKVLTCQ